MVEIIILISSKLSLVLFYGYYCLFWEIFVYPQVTNVFCYISL